MKYICTAVVCLLNLCLFAQSPRFIYPVANNREIKYVAFSEDSRLVLTRSEGAANVWELASGRLLYSQPIDDISNVVFSDDGRFLASGYNGDILVTEIISGKQYSIETGTESQKKILFSHNGTMILAKGYENDSLTLWTNPGGKFIRAYKGNIGRHVAFTPSDHHLIIRFDDRCEKWDLLNMTLNKPLTTIKLDGWIGLSRDGETFTSHKQDKIYIWNFNSTVPVAEIKIPQREIVKYEFSGNGKRLISYGKDSTAVVLDVLSGELVRKFEFRSLVNGSSISADGKKLAVYYENVVILYDVASGIIIDSVSNNFGGDFNEYTLAFSPDGKWLSLGDDSRLVVYSTVTKLSKELEANFEKIYQVMLSPDNKHLLSSTNKFATYWDIATAKPLVRTWMSRDGFDCAFNDDGTKLLMWDGRDMKLVSFPEGKSLLTIRNARHGKISRPFISGDGKKIGLVDYDDISIWKDSAKVAVKFISRTTSTIAASVVFNYDGNYFLTANKDSVLFYLADKGTLLKKFTRNKTDSAFIFTYISRDDKYMMTHDALHLHATVWDIASGEKLYNIDRDNPQFTMDAKYIIAGETVHEIATGRPVENSTKNVSTYPLQIPIADKFITKYSDHDILKKNLIQVTESKTGYTYYLLSLSLQHYLVFDEHGRFDGTPEARALLSLACGDRILEKAEGLDKLWVPGLAEKIMKGEVIKGKKLRELVLCK